LAHDSCGEILEARGGIEPPIKVLQTFALPLGERAPSAGRESLRTIRLRINHSRQKQQNREI
jgi:hypothetical protein